MFYLRLLAFLTCLAPLGFSAETLRVMTFNVRYPATSDGRNVWDARREILVSAIRDANPDVFGTQELFQTQGDYIVQQLPEYAWFGLSRRGNHEDEHMGVFYKKTRLELTGSGDFWLSETPDKPGSSAWNMSLPRMVTWASFRDRATGRAFRFLNTHFPHRAEDEQARVECARVLLSRLPPEGDVVLTGDFNTGLESEAHKVLERKLADAWKNAPSRTGPIGTFHGFSGKPGAERIDWILYRGAIKPLSVETVTMQVEGRYPSDHFPVLAVLQFAE